MRENLVLKIDKPNHDIVSLNDDSKLKSLEAIDKMLMSLSLLKSCIEGDSLEMQTISSTLSISEYSFKNISSALGYDSIIAKKMEERYSEIREANRKIHALEKELENKSFENITSVEVKDYIESIENKIRKWWKTFGFCYVKGVKVNGSRIIVNFGFSTISDYLEEIENPATEKRARESWRESKIKDWDISTSDGFEVLNTDRNNKQLKDLFDMIGGQIFKIEICRNRIMEIEVTIRHDSSLRKLF